ncbi:MAG: hypothetical protein M1570_02950 [Chloroflexi bacterium]|nr:hypothetical protein [Chloroflexota bacterium]
MDRPQLIETAPPDETTLRAWEEMRVQILHDLQEGGEVADSTVDAIADLVVRFDFLRLRRPMSRPLAA